MQRQPACSETGERRRAPALPSDDPVDREFFEVGDEGRYEGGPASRPPEPVEVELERPPPWTPEQLDRRRRMVNVVVSVMVGGLALAGVGVTKQVAETEATTAAPAAAGPDEQPLQPDPSGGEVIPDTAERSPVQTPAASGPAPRAESTEAVREEDGASAPEPAERHEPRAGEPPRPGAAPLVRQREPVPPRQALRPRPVSRKPTPAKRPPAPAPEKAFTATFEPEPRAARRAASTAAFPLD